MLAPEELERRIREALPEAESVSVRALTRGGDHLEVRVVSSKFAGLSMAERHLRVFEPLRALLKASAVQALALETFTPEQWQGSQGRT